MSGFFFLGNVLLKKTCPGVEGRGAFTVLISRIEGGGQASHPCSWGCCRRLQLTETHVFTLKINPSAWTFLGSLASSPAGSAVWGDVQMLEEGEPFCPIWGEPAEVGAGAGQRSPRDRKGPSR